MTQYKYRRVERGLFVREWTRADGSTGQSFTAKIISGGREAHQVLRDPKTKRKPRNVTEARKLFTALKAGLFDGGEVERKRAATVEAFIREIYLPWAEVNHTPSHYQSDRWRTEVIKEHFGDLRLDQVSTFAVEKFKKLYREQKTKRKATRRPASVNRALQLLSKILSLAVERKLIRADQKPAIKLLREDNHRLRYLDVEEEERLMAILAEYYPYLADIVAVGLATGLRKSELLGLRVADVDFNQAVIHVLQTKSGRPRAVPVGEEAATILWRQVKPGAEFVWTSRRTGRPYLDPKKAMREACRLSKLEGVTLHVLRHTYGTRLAAAGVDVATIKELMGHSDIKTTMRYVHAVAGSKQAAIVKMADYLNRRKTVAIEEGRGLQAMAK